MKVIVPAVALSALMTNNSAINVAAKTNTQLIIVPVTNTNSSAIYEQMGTGSDGHTIQWKLLGIGKASTAGSFISSWITGQAAVAADVYPRRIQIYVP